MVYSMASNFIAEAETGIIIIMQPPQFSLLFFLWHELQHKLVSFYDLVITGPEDNLTTLILGHPMMDYCKLCKFRLQKPILLDQHLWTAGLWFSIIQSQQCLNKNPNFFHNVQF